MSIRRHGIQRRVGCMTLDQSNCRMKSHDHHRFLVKRSQGRTRGPKNWRKRYKENCLLAVGLHPLYCRYFCLTAKNLTYAKAKGESPLCTIASHELLAVERVDDNAFTLRYVSLGGILMDY